jgi:hypothetical protein
MILRGERFPGEVESPTTEDSDKSLGHRWTPDSCELVGGVSRATNTFRMFSGGKNASYRCFVRMNAVNRRSMNQHGPWRNLVPLNSILNFLAGFRAKIQARDPTRCATSKLSHGNLKTNLCFVHSK